MRDDVAVAISALEVLLFELLGCQARDQINITADMGGDTPDGIVISAITVSRGEGKVFFIDAEPLVLQGTFRLVRSYFLNAAKSFVLETIQPGYRHHLHSVGKLMAFAKEVDLEEAFQEEAYRLGKQRRLQQ